MYLSVGAAIAFLLTASLLFAVCQCVRRPRNNRHRATFKRDDKSNTNLLLADASQYSIGSSHRWEDTVRETCDGLSTQFCSIITVIINAGNVSQKYDRMIFSRALTCF